MIGPPPETRREVGGSLGATRREAALAESGTRREEDDGSFESPRTLINLPRGLADRYSVVREIPSKGNESDLLLVEDRTGGLCVVKVYRPGIEPKTEVLKRISQAAPEHVIRLLDYGHSDGRAWEVLEYAPEGSLGDLLRREGPRLDVETVREILIELNEALAHLHSEGIEHRDLKPDNILVRVRRPPDLVLTDFGIASVIEGSRRFTSGAGTVYYAPPEAPSGVVVKGADYWSLGVILVEALTGTHPFQGMSDQVAMSRLATQPTDELVAEVKDPRWQLLCRGLLRREPRNRWGNSEVDRWLRGDTSLTVVEESVAPAYQATARNPITIFGGVVHTPSELAAVLAAHWRDAYEHLEERRIQNWVALGDFDLASALADIDRETLDLDARLFKAILRCDPTRQPFFVDAPLDIDALRKWATDALSGGVDARAHLASIYTGQLLSFTSEVTGDPTFSAIEAQWRAALEEYEVLRQQLTRTTPRLLINPVDDDIRAQLLLASLPDGVGGLSHLRQRALRLASRDARECSWFRNLGDPSTASAAALLLVPNLVHEAETETRETRQREHERRVAELKRFISRTARVGGWALALILIAVLARSLWNSLPRSTPQLASGAVTGPEYISPLPYTVSHRPDDLMEYLKRGGYQLSNTAVRFRPQAQWLAVSWPAEISNAREMLPISFDSNVFLADCRTRQPANVNSWQVLNAGGLDLHCNPFQARADNGGSLYFYYRSGAASAPPYPSAGGLPLVPLKFCEEFVRDGDPKGCFDASRGARYTRKWYIRQGVTASLPWFPDRTASTAYMRAFGNDHIFLEGCSIRVDVNINVPNSGFPLGCRDVTVSSSTGGYLYISSSIR